MFSEHETSTEEMNFPDFHTYTPSGLLDKQKNILNPSILDVNTIVSFPIVTDPI